MTCATFLAKVARWSYFLSTVAMILGSFVHLNISFNTEKCSEIAPTLNVTYTCIGRNLIWLTKNQLSIDSNQKTWRTVFNLGPELFIAIWCPLFMSTLAFIQHFEGSKWDLISGSWFRAFLFTLFWNLFGVFGYAANWGVVMGFFGVCWVNALYFIMICISPSNDIPVLQIDVAPLTGRVKSIKDRRLSRRSQTNNGPQTDNTTNNDQNFNQTNYDNNYTTNYDANANINVNNDNNNSNNTN